MKLVWTRLAHSDRGAIRTYIAQDNPAAALALDTHLSRTVRHLATHPDLGRPGRVVGTRELVVHANYIAVYDVVRDTVRILRVLHAARQWPLTDNEPKGHPTAVVPTATDQFTKTAPLRPKSQLSQLIAIPVLASRKYRTTSERGIEFQARPYTLMGA